uniref:Putative ribbon-helix-helix protein repressor n=2 Tax=viral metagenome TaxID=1070528 RepID=A0A6M3JSU2_9ZZZZ
MVELPLFLHYWGVAFMQEVCYSDTMEVDKKDSNVVTNLHLPKEMKDWLTMEATRRMMSRSDLIRQALIMYRERREDENS